MIGYLIPMQGNSKLLKIFISLDYKVMGFSAGKIDNFFLYTNFSKLT